MVLNKSSRVKKVLVAVAIILCAVVTRCECQNDHLGCAKRLEDGTCNVTHLHDNNFLLVNNFDDITRVPLNGEKQILVSPTFQSDQIDHDCAEGRFYGIGYDTNQIYSANYNGTDEELFIKDKSFNPLGLAVDWISRRLYWTDSKKATIEVASLENPTVRTVLIYGDLKPFPIAVDPLRGKLYWSNSFDNETIEWSNLDGSERQVLVSSPQISYVTSIKVSTSTGELCYLDQDQNLSTGRIECIDPSSKQIRTIASNLTDPHELAITDEVFYWTNWKLKTIERISADGVRLKPFIMTRSRYIIGVTAVIDKCPVLYSPCARNNGDCPENTICLTNSGAPAGRSCIVKKKCTVNSSEDKCDQLILDN